MWNSSWIHKRLHFVLHTSIDILARIPIFRVAILWALWNNINSSPFPCIQVHHCKKSRCTIPYERQCTLRCGSARRNIVLLFASKTLTTGVPKVYSTLMETEFCPQEQMNILRICPKIARRFFIFYYLYRLTHTSYHKQEFACFYSKYWSSTKKLMN